MRMAMRKYALILMTSGLISQVCQIWMKKLVEWHPYTTTHQQLAQLYRRENHRLHSTRHLYHDVLCLYSQPTKIISPILVYEICDRLSLAKQTPTNSLVASREAEDSEKFGSRKPGFSNLKWEIFLTYYKNIHHYVRINVISSWWSMKKHFFSREVQWIACSRKLLCCIGETIPAKNPLIPHNVQSASCIRYLMMERADIGKGDDQSELYYKFWKRIRTLALKNEKSTIKLMAICII